MDRVDIQTRENYKILTVYEQQVELSPVPPASFVNTKDVLSDWPYLD